MLFLHALHISGSLFELRDAEKLTLRQPLNNDGDGDVDADVGCAKEEGEDGNKGILALF